MRLVREPDLRKFPSVITEKITKISAAKTLKMFSDAWTRRSGNDSRGLLEIERG